MPFLAEKLEISFNNYGNPEQAPTGVGQKVSDQ